MKMSEESFRKKFLWNLGLLCAAQVRMSTWTVSIRRDLVHFLSGTVVVFVTFFVSFKCVIGCVSDSSVTQNALNG